MFSMPLAVNTPLTFSILAVSVDSVSLVSDELQLNKLIERIRIVMLNSFLALMGIPNLVTFYKYEIQAL